MAGVSGTRRKLGSVPRSRIAERFLCVAMVASQTATGVVQLLVLWTKRNPLRFFQRAGSPKISF